MKRGDIWWAELGGDAGFRPVLVVSRNDGLPRRSNTTIAEITRVVRSLPSEVPLSPADGLPVECVVNTDNIHTIPKSNLREWVTSLSAERLFALDQALRYSLELE